MRKKVESLPKLNAKEQIIKKEIEKPILNLLRTQKENIVENFSQTLFDEGNGLEGDRNKAIEAMHHIALKDINFIAKEGTPTFAIPDGSGRELIFSNRDSVNGELRGALLRNELTKLKNENPDSDMTLYEAINQIINKKFTSSSSYVYFLNGLNTKSAYLNEAIIKATEVVDEFFKKNPNATDEQLMAVFQSEYDQQVLAGRSQLPKEERTLFNLDTFKTEIQQDADIYRPLSNLFKKNIDREFGIVSGWENNDWMQDATLATPLKDNTSKRIVESNSVLLRSLLRTQAIDNAMGEKLKHVKNPADAALITEIREEMREQLLSFTSSLAGTTKPPSFEEIQHHEKLFNTYLVRCMHEANLSGGCTTEKDAVALLDKYSLKMKDSEEAKFTTYYMKGDKLSANQNANPYSYKIRGHNSVDNVSFLKERSKLMETQYQENYNSFLKMLVVKDPKNQELVDAGKEVMKALLEIEKGGLTPKKIVELNAIIHFCKKALENPQDSKNLENINHFAEKYSSKGILYLALSNALTLFANVALGLAAALLAIPTMGVSLKLLSKNTKMEDLPGIDISRKMETPMSDFKKALTEMKNEKKAEHQEQVSKKAEEAQNVEVSAHKLQ